MLLFLTVVLILSSLGMTVLLYAKHWELTTGRTLLPDMRPVLHGVSIRILFGFEKQLPAVLRRAGLRLWRWTRIHARNLIVKILIALEHTLESLLTMLKHGLSPATRARGQASGFLREVAEHKRKLTRTARVRRQKTVQDIAPAEPPVIE